MVFAFPRWLTRGIADADQVRANIRASVTRGLPPVEMCALHDKVMHIMAGGPSLEDTWRDADGILAAVNGAHDFLIKKGVVPRLCCVVDPQPILATMITPHRGVTYLVASMCDPAVFDRLDGFDVRIWHAGQGDSIEISDLMPEGHLYVPGGSTAALRMIELADILGFRDVHLHGMDSSFRVDGQHHAYDAPIYGDDKLMEIQGYKTSSPLAAQISCLCMRLPFWRGKITMHGDGLMQHLWRQHFGATTTVLEG